jgi:hypothetical protein
VIGWRHVPATPSSKAVRHKAIDDIGEEMSPVIILTYVNSGAERLRALLSGDRRIKCTATSGVLPLCHNASNVWRRAESRREGISELGLRSIRMMVSLLMLPLTANDMSAVWCETCIAPAYYAEDFVKLFPGTRYICLHRECSSVLRMEEPAADRDPAGDSCGQHAAHVVSYWVTRTEMLLEFEKAHPEICLRVRYEDLQSSQEAADSIFGFLGLGPLNGGGMLPAGFADARKSIELETHDAGIGDILNGSSGQLGGRVQELLEELGYRK